MIMGYFNDRKRKAFYTTAFVILLNERMSRSKTFYFLMQIKETCVRKFGRLTRLTIPEALHTVYSAAIYSVEKRILQAVT